MMNLREAIAAHQPLVAPSIYDGISALVARECGFDAVYVGSYATGATLYGVPDIGYLGVEDMAAQVRRLAPLVRVPIIVDGEGGFGNPLHVARSVRLLEQAGAAATHIEDHEFGKHLTSAPKVLALSDSVDKIKSALDARASSDFMIIARTDATGSLGPAAALERAVAFQEAGADGVFLAGYGFSDSEAWSRLREVITVPVFNTDMPGQSTADAAALGVDVVLFYALSHTAALEGIRTVLRPLADSGSVSEERAWPSVRDFDNFLGIAEARANALKYGLFE